MKTKFKKKCEILADVWINYRDDTEFTDFIEYNDLGLPLAYALDAGIVEKTGKAKGFIDETFELLLAGFGVDEDTGFDSLEDIMDADD